MGATFADWIISGALAVPRWQRGTCVESNHRPNKPQYHVMFDNDFTTVPYMKAGTSPPNWQELIEHSSEMATTEDVFKADTWLSVQQMVNAMDQMTEPFEIVTDQHKKQRPQRHADNKRTPITEHAVSEGDCLPHS